MNITALMGNWGLAREKLRERYDTLTDNDLAFVKDQEEEMLRQIERKTGATRAEIVEYLQQSGVCPV